jgi:hypothetical protein
LTTRILRVALRANSHCSFVRIGFLPIRRASAGSQATLGANFRPLPPEGGASVVSPYHSMSINEQQMAKICC